MRSLVLLLILAAAGAGTSSAAETYKLLNLVLWSDTLHDSAKCSVVLPPGYDANPSRRYPVMYMTQGIASQEIVRGVGPYLLSPTGLAKPFICVYVDWHPMKPPYTNPRSVVEVPWTDWDCNGATYFTQFFVPYIDSVYRTIRSRYGRVLCGHSKGGGGCLYLQLKYPELFCATAPFDGILLDAGVSRTGTHDEDSYRNSVYLGFPALERTAVRNQLGSNYQTWAYVHQSLFVSLGLKNTSLVPQKDAACGHSAVCHPSEYAILFAAYDSALCRQGTLDPPSISSRFFAQGSGCVCVFFAPFCDSLRPILLLADL